MQAFRPANADMGIVIGTGKVLHLARVQAGFGRDGRVCAAYGAVCRSAHIGRSTLQIMCRA